MIEYGFEKFWGFLRMCLDLISKFYFDFNPHPKSFSEGEGLLPSPFWRGAGGEEKTEA
jgi:hypothetical protein